MLTIWDLDHTVIDSSHRQLTREDGSLDLEHWIENCTRQKIMADSLLPLVHEMRERFRKGHITVICTARVLGRFDYDFLLAKDIPFDHILSRPKNSRERDADLKVRQLTRLLERLNIRPRDAEMFDDNESVLAAVSLLGVKCYDAKKLNMAL